jgi:hypothetical protein
MLVSVLHLSIRADMRGNLLGRCDKVNHISVHKALVVPVRTRQVVQKESLVGQN